jgi:hypothetical protein
MKLGQSDPPVGYLKRKRPGSHDENLSEEENKPGERIFQTLLHRVESEGNRASAEKGYTGGL